jgi:hypothetical protein
MRTSLITSLSLLFLSNLTLGIAIPAPAVKAISQAQGGCVYCGSANGEPSLVSCLPTQRSNLRAKVLRKEKRMRLILN